MAKKELVHKAITPADSSPYAAVKQAAAMPLKLENFTYSQKMKSIYQRKGIADVVLKTALIFEKELWFQGIPEGMEVEVSCSPVFRRKELVGVKYYPLDFIDGGEFFFLQVDGAEKYFIGLERLQDFYDVKKELEYIIITQNEIDRLSFLQCGYKNVISLPDTTEFNFIDEEHIECFKRVQVIYLCFEKNTSGIELVDEISRRVGKPKCKVLTLPDDYESVNEVISLEGPNKNLPDADRWEKLKYLITTARPLQVSGIYKVQDFTIEINDIYEHGFPQGFKSGKYGVDRMWSIHPGMFSVLTGVPSSGKSTFLKCMYPHYTKWAKDNGRHLKMGMYTSEDKRASTAMTKMIQTKVGKFVHPHDNQMSRMELMEAKAWLNENFILIRPEGVDAWLVSRGIKRANTLSGILAYAEICVVMYGMNWLVIDNWSTIEKDYQKGEIMDSFVSRSLGAISEFCVKFNCHVTLVAHPTKTEVDSHGNFKPITLYSINGSSHFYNAPDLGIITHRQKFRPARQEDEEAYYKKYLKQMPKTQWIRDYRLPTTVECAKVREEWIGHEGSMNVYMDHFRGNSFVYNKEELHKSNKSVSYTEYSAPEEHRADEEPVVEQTETDQATDDAIKELPF